MENIKWLTFREFFYLFVNFDSGKSFDSSLETFYKSYQFFWFLNRVEALVELNVENRKKFLKDNDHPDTLINFFGKILRKNIFVRNKFS